MQKETYLILAGLCISTFLFFSTSGFVLSGYVGIYNAWGHTEDNIYDEGVTPFRFSPLGDFEMMQYLLLQREDITIGTTPKDYFWGTEIGKMKVTISWRLQKEKSPYIYKTYGGDRNPLAGNDIQRSIKNAITRFTPGKAASIYGPAKKSYIDTLIVPTSKTAMLDETSRMTSKELYWNETAQQQFKKRLSRIISDKLAKEGVLVDETLIEITAPNRDKMENDSFYITRKKEIAENLKNASITLPCYDWMDVSINESLAKRKVCGYDLEIKAAKPAGDETEFRMGVIFPDFENVNLTWIKIDGSRNFAEGFRMVISRNHILDIAEKNLIFKVHHREHDIIALEIKRYGTGF